ncbi:hypothetical protein PIB30_088274 [Stylosanthes scabra]|uniref:Uncharacterized protein n=1 Tax=Stylosanthes scabra TaxID=79078 RepID=A0ABU6TUC9_9FABA|nr:hypothetical protein [Stylosanthes scabra]
MSQYSLKKNDWNPFGPGALKEVIPKTAFFTSAKETGSMRTGVVFFEYPIVQMYEAPDHRAAFIWGEPRYRIYGFYDHQFTFPLLSLYFDSDVPYGIPLSSLHPWMPPPPPAPPTEVFEENDDEMA